jgi:LPS-assembly protein
MRLWGDPSLRTALFQVILAFIAVFIHSVGMAQENNSLKKGMRDKAVIKAGDEPWTIEAVQVGYDFKNEVYTAEGNVLLYSSDRSIVADRAVLSSKEQEVDLQGNVELRFGKDWLRGEHVVWHLDTETGWVDGGIVFFAENNFSIRSNYIEKTGPTTYVLSAGAMTTCDPYDPDWSISFDKLNVNTEGYAWARSASMRAGKLPVLYMPIAALPVSRERQSGVLLPTFGTSDTAGFEFELPFYWAIRKDMDATFYPHYMADRGLMAGIEYRIDNDTWGRGIWMLHFLEDQGDPLELAKEGYPIDDTERYWLRARHSFDLPHNIHGWLNLDIASDISFLREFDIGSPSYSATSAAFLKSTGTGILTDENAIQRESNLYLNRPEEDTLMALDVHYWDNLDPATDERTLQQFPRFIYDIAPNLMSPNHGLYYSLNSSLVNYFRNEGDRGQRLDLYPRFYYPLHWRSYLNVEPSVALRSTSYWVDWEEGNRDSFQQRTYPELRVDLNTQLDRVYSLNWGDAVALQNMIRPEIIYKYRPFADENDDIPEFDAIDQITERHGVQYGFSTAFTAKRLPKGVNAPSYHEYARLSIFQTLNIEKVEPEIQDRLLYDESIFGTEAALFGPLLFSDLDIESSETQSELLEKRRFSSVDVEFYLTPLRYIQLSYDANISPYDKILNRYNYGLSLNSQRGQSLSLNYRLREDSNLEELVVGTGLNLLPSLSFSTSHDYSFSEGVLISQVYSLLYQTGCWGLRFAIGESEGNQTAGVSLILLGIGEFGGGTKSGSGAFLQQP